MSGASSFPFEERIASRASRVGIELPQAQVEALAAHARSVLSENERLHLTSIHDPETFVERHLGESFEGASLIDAGARGTLLDLGSGNGYPGLPLAAARPGMSPLLAEVSERKAAFLEPIVTASPFEGRVLHRQVQRAADLEDLGLLRLISTRAMGGWERIVPRLAASLADDGELLLWAGNTVEQIATRKAWKRFELRDRHPLPGRDRSWVWRFGKRA